MYGRAKGSISHFSVLLLLVVTTAKSQNDYNAYQDFAGDSISNHEHGLPKLNFTGEYQWALAPDLHYWQGSDTLDDAHKSFKIEVVSFPLRRTRTPRPMRIR